MTEGSWGSWWKRGKNLQHYSPKWFYFGGAIASLSKWVKVGKSDSFKCIWCYHQPKYNWGLTYHVITFYWDFTCLWLWDLDGSDPVLASDKSRDSLTNQSVPGKEKVLTRPCGNRLIYKNTIWGLSVDSSGIWTQDLRHFCTSGRRSNQLSYLLLLHGPCICHTHLLWVRFHSLISTGHCWTEVHNLDIPNHAIHA